MSDRKLDSKGRWRSRVVAFRVSDEEAELLNRLVDISGLTKQDYLIKKTTDHKVVVKGSIRVFGALKAQLTYVYEELKRLDKVTPKNDELMELIKVISMILLKIEENENALKERYPLDAELIDGIVEIMTEVTVSTNDYIVIASNSFPKEVVKSRFLKLNFSHLEYVMSCFKSNTTKVKNIKKYLLASLFNAPSTMNGYYTAEVNHDMPQYASRR